MNEHTRQIKKTINEARENFAPWIKKENTSSEVYIEQPSPSTDYVHIRFVRKDLNSSWGGSISISGYAIFYDDINNCDVPEIQKLFTTGSGMQHLSRYLLGKESCLVKD